MDRFRLHFFGLLLVVMTGGLFWQVGQYGLFWDDRVNIFENHHFNPPSLTHALDFWVSPYQRLYIPLTYTVWAGLARIAEIPAAQRRDLKFSPRPFHLFNLAVHILSILVVFVLLRTLVGHDWAAFGGALFFAWHPVQVEPVAWITGLKDVLSGCLSLVAIWLYLKHKRLPYILATLAFVLAVLSKPSAVGVPLVVWVLDYSMLRRSARQCTLRVIPWVVLASAFIAVNKLAQPDTVISFIAPLWARPLVAADAVTFYLYKLVFPVWLGLDYGRSPEWLLHQEWIYLIWTIPFGVLVLMWLWRDRKPWLLASGGVFVAAILPVSGLIPFVFQDISTVADRYLYLSLLGPALSLAWVLSESRKRSVWALSLLILLLLGVRSAFQVGHWRDDITLYNHALRINPLSWVTHYSLGKALDRLGIDDDAMIHYRESARIRPTYADAHNNLGVALAARGQLDEAMREYRLSIQIRPDYTEAYYNLANALASQGRLEEAFKHYKIAIKTDPGYAKAYNNLGIALAKQGRREEAIVQFREALKIDSGFAKAHANLGHSLWQEGYLDEAVKHYSQAVYHEPDFAEAHEMLGRALAQQGKFDEAIEHFKEAVRIMKSK